MAPLYDQRDLAEIDDRLHYVERDIVAVKARVNIVVGLLVANLGAAFALLVTGLR